jgi:exopolysaccharide biosynthesis protein
MDGSANRLMTMRTFSKYVAETGCLQAYALDGGQTTTIVLNNEVVNHVNYGSERKISDIIYFTTAIPQKE